MGSLSGTLTGWGDVKLSEYGRRQAFTLSQCLTQFHFPLVYSSDLERSKQTAFYSLGFPHESTIKQTSLLREINFGKDEGIHFDSLSAEDKQRINSPHYKAEEGESWDEVRRRFTDFTDKVSLSDELPYVLAFTHGGLMCTVLREFGEEEVPNNCSVAGLLLGEERTIKGVEVLWKFPAAE